MDKKAKNKKDHNHNDVHNLTACDWQLLELLTGENVLSKLTKQSGRKKPNVHATAQRLISRGLADNRNGLYFLSGYGIKILNENRYDEPEGFNDIITASRNPVKKKKRPIRLHDLSFSIKFWSIPPGWNHMRGTVFGLDELQESPLYNSELAKHVNDYTDNQKFRGGGLQILHFNNYIVYTFTNSIRILLPEIIRDEPEEATDEAWRVLMEFLPKLERHLGIPQMSLWNNRRLNIKVCTSHYALFKSAFAKYMIKDLKENRFVVPDNLTGKPRLIVDQSHGDLETETVLPLSAEPDMMRIKTVFNQYMDEAAPLPKDVGIALDMIGAQVIDLNKTVMQFQPVFTESKEIIADLSVNIKAHTGTAKANLIAADALNRAIDRLDKMLARLLWPITFINKLIGRK